MDAGPSKPKTANLRRQWRWQGFLFTSIAVSVAISLLLPIVVGWVLTHPPRLAIWRTPAAMELQFETVNFLSREDQVELIGWWVPSARGHSNRTVVVTHGYGSNRSDFMTITRDLVGAGYNVLRFDFRHAGDSGGEAATFGWLERWDLAGAVDYARQRGSTKIGILGYSMGGSAALLAAADLSEVDAVVADSAFSDLKQLLNDNMGHWTRLPDFPFGLVMRAALPHILGVDLEDVSPISVIDRLANRPLLVIHGDKDIAIPPRHAEAIHTAYLDAGGTMGQIWLVPGGTHVENHRAAPDEYRDRVLRFFQTHMH